MRQSPSEAWREWEGIWERPSSCNQDEVLGLPRSLNRKIEEECLYLAYLCNTESVRQWNCDIEAKATHDFLLLWFWLIATYHLKFFNVCNILDITCILIFFYRLETLVIFFYKTCDITFQEKYWLHPPASVSLNLPVKFGIWWMDGGCFGGWVGLGKSNIIGYSLVGWSSCIGYPIF